MWALALSRLRLAVFLATGAALITPGPAQATVPAGNLVKNPGADAAAGESDATGAAIPSWGTAGRLSAVKYATTVSGYPTTTVRDAIGGGANFFSGGVNDDTSIADQIVDLSAAQPEIDAGQVSVALSAYLGGSGTDGDNVTVKAEFQDASSDNTFLTIVLGPVTAAQRQNQTTLLPRSATATVPPLSRHIRLTITATRTDANRNNGYADNISATLEFEAKGDTATVTEDAAATPVDVLANDPAGGTPRKIASVTQPPNGTVAITGGGSGLTYKPNANTCNSQAGGAPDSFSYTLNTGGTASVAMTVTCVDDPPTAVNDSATVAHDAAAAPIEVLANDADADGGPKQVTGATQPANGSVALGSGGAGLTYKPNAGYCNSRSFGVADSFTYTLNGGSTASVAVTVTCPPLPPIPPFARVRPLQVTAKTTPRRDRTRPYTFTTKGTIVPPREYCGATASGAGPCIGIMCPPGVSDTRFCVRPSRSMICSGVVVVRVKKQSRTVSSRQVHVKADCTFRSRVTIRTRTLPRGGILRIRARFQGNAVLLPRNSSTTSVRAG